MAQITTLKDKDGKSLYPLTSSKAVLDANGVDLDTRLERTVEKEQGKGLSSADFTNEEKQKLSTLPTSAKLNEQIAAKQVVLQSSDDIEVAGSKLSLTEQAKLQWIINRFDDWCAGTLTGQKFNVGGYNKTTGYFECNGILDIGIEEAKAMLEYAPLTRFILPNHTENRWIFKTHGYHTVRTLFPICFVNSGTNSGSGVSMFHAWTKLEVVHFVTSNFSSAASIFNSCNKLRRVTGHFAASNLGNAFWRCYDLEHVEIYNLSTDVSFADCSKLDSESLYFICSNKNNTNKTTVTLHPTTFALLTDEDNEEWFPLIELAQSKNITFVSA